MQDYSDLFFLIGAIAIYALLVNNTNSNMLHNNQMLTTTEMEYGAVSVAQNVIEEARWMSYNDATENNLENVNDDSLYNVEISISNININESNEANKKIDIIVTNAYLPPGSNTPTKVTMSYIKTDRN